MNKQKKILVDMSASIIHHGHIRLLKKASKYGKVIVGLTTDSDLKKFKNLNTEIKFRHRAEILRSIKYVNKVIPSNYIINDKFIKNNIDLVVNGGDYKNRKFKVRSICFSRTKNISSSIIRKKLLTINYEKSKK